MGWNPDDVVSVSCIEDTDPKQVLIILIDAQSFAVPYTFYQLIQEPLGLPDIIC